MSTRARLTLGAALATALVALSLTPLLATSLWVAHAWLLVLVTAGVGAGLRRLPVPRVLVVPLQLLIVLYVLLLGFVQSAMIGGVLPGARTFGAVGDLLASGGNDIRDYAIPAPATGGLRLIVVGSVTLIAVAVDALAVTYRRAAAAGLPLLALYSVSTGLAGGLGASWLWFLLGAVGYLALLHTEGRDRLSRWGRVFHGRGRTGGTVARGGARVGLIALTLALVVPAFVPHGGLGLVDGLGKGNGPGKGPGGLSASLNPVVALTSGLRRTDYAELFRYQTNAADPTAMYLRIGALDEFDGVEWRFGQQSLEPVPKSFPAPAGLSTNVLASGVDTQVSVSDGLSSEWLPMPYPPASVSVPGRWRLDPATMTMVGDGGQRTNGLKYRVTSLDVQPTADQLKNAGDAPPEVLAKYLQLPRDLPPVVAATARQVTRGKNTRYDQAVALQTWFAQGQFTYSTKVDAGTGSDAIVKFLNDKTGFCVHFSATMAAMARSLGIPARVAIGFTPGKSAGGGSYVVGTLDYHAWPELYFPGTGWTRFEPTPSRGNAPGYTRPQAQPSASASSQRPTAAPSDSAAAAPSNSADCTAAKRRTGDCGDTGASAAQNAKAPAWWLSWPALAGYALIGLVLVLLAVPMLWRIQVRRRRLGVGRRAPGAAGPELTDAQVLAAWQELIDSAWDLGIPPDDARTPRRTVQRLAEAAELDAEAGAAAGRVALATEQVLYARELHPPAPLGGDVRVARDGLRASARRAARVRAVLWPASSVRIWWRLRERTEAVRDRVAGARDRAADPMRSAVRRVLPERFRQG